MSDLLPLLKKKILFLTKKQTDVVLESELYKLAICCSLNDREVSWQYNRKGKSWRYWALGSFQCSASVDLGRTVKRRTSMRDKNVPFFPSVPRLFLLGSFWLGCYKQHPAPLCTAIPSMWRLCFSFHCLFSLNSTSGLSGTSL